MPITEILNNTTRKQKITFLVLFFLIIAAIIIVIILYPRPKIIPIKDIDQYLPLALNEDKVSLEQDLYSIASRSSSLDNNSIIAVIRDGSFHEEMIDDKINKSDFLVDIDSIQQTYAISFLWAKDTHVPNNVIIDCPKLSESKYPKSNCIGMYNSTQSLQAEENTPISKILPIIVKETIESVKTLNHYEIHGSFDSEYNFRITITDYTGGNYDRALQTIRDKGFNPEDYNIKYYDYSKYSIF